MVVFQFVAVFVALSCMNFFVVGHGNTVFNATVSLDGSGDYKTIKDAIAAAPDNSITRFYIHVMAGTYNEHVEIPSTKTFVALIGDDASTTIIVDNRSNRIGFKTFHSATFSKFWSYPFSFFFSFSYHFSPYNM